MRGYTISALVDRGVNLVIARKLVDKQIIEQPICVDILSKEDIDGLIDLLVEIESES